MEAFTQIGRWHISHDAELTRLLYEQWKPEQCNCNECSNFREAINSALSPPFQMLLKQLGIDRSKPSELCHYGVPGEPCPTGGWYHFAGSLLDGRDTWQPVNETTHGADFDDFLGMKGIGFTNHLALVPAPFQGSTILQLEFSTITPWVIDIPLLG